MMRSLARPTSCRHPGIVRHGKYVVPARQPTAFQVSMSGTQRTKVVVQAAQFEDANIPNPLGLTADEKQQLWSATSRALLKLGKGGVSESHCSNLRSLLASHTVVRVQLNMEPSGVLSMAQELAKGSGAYLLGVQGRNMLFGKGSCDKGQLLKTATSSSQKIQAYHQKRLETKQRAEAEAQGIDSDQGSSNPSKGGSRSPSGASRSSGQGALDKIIAQNVGRAGFSREALKAEWDGISKALFTDEIAEVESRMRDVRAGRRPLSGVKGAFGAPEPGRGGRGGRGGRSGAGRGRGPAGAGRGRGPR